MFSYLVTITYDGSDFFGWAKQKDKLTAQGYIEEKITKVLNQQNTVFASSRTDKGVHANNQNFVIRLKNSFNEQKLLLLFRRSLGLILVKKVKLVDNDFHPLYNVSGKEYRYFINIGKFNFWKTKYRWEYNRPILLSRLIEGLRLFQGEHNFFNFSYCRFRERHSTNTIRRINFLKVNKKSNIIVIIIKSDTGFLRYQIRAIIGEVIGYCEGKQEITDLKQKLTLTDCNDYKYKNLAPACGLYLWRIWYKI